MKKLIVFSVLFALLAMSAGPLLAGGSATPTKKEQKADNPGSKLVRGVVNGATCVLEIPNQIHKEWKSTDNVLRGCTTGLLKGFIFSIGRLGSGVWDIVSFPFKTPAAYKPLMEPKFVFDKK